MTKFLINIILLLLFFSITNCSDNPTNIEQLKYDVALSCIIVTDSVRQKALLSYVKSIDSEYSNYADLIDSANFYINNTKLLYNPFPDLELFHNRERYYNYYSDSLNLSAGDTVNLTISKNNFSIYGQTVIPGNFEINIKGKTISWTKSKNAFYYFIKIINGNRTFTWQTSTDQLSVIIDDKDFIEDDYKIVVSAFDRNYYNYYHTKKTQVGIEGAYGIFGAANRQTIVGYLH